MATGRRPRAEVAPRPRGGYRAAVLVATDLRDWLREFADRQYANFRGFPPTRDDARHEWAKAFARYFATGDEADAGTALTPRWSEALHDAVRDAFYADLDLLGPTAHHAAVDFAGAWRAGVDVLAQAPTLTATLSGAMYTFDSYSDLSQRHASLLATLEALFEIPSPDGLTRLGDIANAFHVATTSVTVTATRAPGGATTLQFV